VYLPVSLCLSPTDFSSACPVFRDQLWCHRRRSVSGFLFPMLSLLGFNTLFFRFLFPWGRIRVGVA
jgi:hypothetical protein